MPRPRWGGDRHPEGEGRRARAADDRARRDVPGDLPEQSLPADAEWLFPSATSKSGHTVALQKPFRAAAVAAGLDPAQVVRHTLRHTAVSHLGQSGVDLPTVKRISGHRTLAMVERYAHQDGDHIQAAVDKLQERMRAGRDPAASAHDYTGITPTKKASAL